MFDLEFNQDISSLQLLNEKMIQYPFEIIQIGAIKLDSQLHTVATFNRYVKPTIYSRINSFITNLTGITTEQLLEERPFCDVYEDLVKFIDDGDSIFCSWGISDMKELFRNVEHHRLNQTLLSRMFINLQPHVSIYLELPSKKLLQLQKAVELLNISTIYQFHNALYDAYYTAEILKQIYNPSIQPTIYDPKHVNKRSRQRKKEIDFDNLLNQFEKMYSRQMTGEEQEIIKLAYKMGKTNQFLK